VSDHTAVKAPASRVTGDKQGKKREGGTMAAAAGILNHNTTAGQALAAKTATPMASGTDSTSGSSDDAATISANDFLTLLVTEMKNQDPTASTDPNEYINQLVNVNSLQQLVSINQTITSVFSSSSSSTDASSTGSSGTAKSSSVEGTDTQAKTASSRSATSLSSNLSATAAKLAPGNLGIPTANASAQSVAQSLSGRARVQ
jgi:flagellar basal-body rod modification protein FlgD